MASGNTLHSGNVLSYQPTSSNFATPDKRNQIFCLDFDDTTAEAALFTFILPRNYAGGGITLYLHWWATTATSGDVVWDGYFARMNAGGQDVDSLTFASAQTATSTTNGTSGIPTSTTITFTDGAQIDSIAVGEAFALKIERNASSGSDTMTGDAELFAFELKET